MNLPLTTKRMLLQGFSEDEVQDAHLRYLTGKAPPGDLGIFGAHDFWGSWHLFAPFFQAMAFETVGCVDAQWGVMGFLRSSGILVIYIYIYIILYIYISILSPPLFLRSASMWLCRRVLSKRLKVQSQAKTRKVQVGTVGVFHQGHSYHYHGN